MARIAEKVRTTMTITLELEHNEGVEFHLLTDRVERSIMRGMATHNLATGRPKVVDIASQRGAQLPLFAGEV